MAGYNHARGMSNNAIRAYDDGFKPISKITIADLREAGLDITKKFATWLAKTGHWPPAEWHHSGGSWYNQVDFYDTYELAELISDGSLDLENLETEFRAVEKPADEIRVTGRYALFGGSRSRPRLVGHQEFTGTLRGNWIFLDGGGKKKANGNHIEWGEIQQ